MIDPHPPEYRIAAYRHDLDSVMAKIAGQDDEAIAIVCEVSAAASLLGEVEIGLLAWLATAVLHRMPRDTSMRRKDALNVLRASVGRWLVGLAARGPLRRDDPRDWARESHEELADYLHYRQLHGDSAVFVLSREVIDACVHLGARTRLADLCEMAAAGPEDRDPLRTLLRRVLNELVDRKAFSSAAQQQLIRDAEEAIR